MGASARAAAPGQAASCPLGMTGTAHAAPAGGVAYTVCTGRVPSFDGTPLDTDLTLPRRRPGAVAADGDAARMGPLEDGLRGHQPGRERHQHLALEQRLVRRARVRGAELHRARLPPVLRPGPVHRLQLCQRPGVPGKGELDAPGRPALGDPRHPVPGRAAGGCRDRGSVEGGGHRRLLRRRAVLAAGARPGQGHAPGRRGSGRGARRPACPSAWPPRCLSSPGAIWRRRW